VCECEFECECECVPCEVAAEVKVYVVRSIQ
jgi:hypothetical protein